MDANERMAGAKIIQKSKFKILREMLEMHETLEA